VGGVCARGEKEGVGGQGAGDGGDGRTGGGGSSSRHCGARRGEVEEEEAYRGALALARSWEDVVAEREAGSGAPAAGRAAHGRDRSRPRAVGCRSFKRRRRPYISGQNPIESNRIESTQTDGTHSRNAAHILMQADAMLGGGLATFVGYKQVTHETTSNTATTVCAETRAPPDSSDRAATLLNALHETQAERLRKPASSDKRVRDGERVGRPGQLGRARA